MNDDEIRWITINGQHVPIHEGESKREAVSKFISSKKTRKNKVQEFKERKQSNNKIKKFVKKGNTYIPVRENENEKDVVKSYSRENDKERMNRIKDLQHNERLAQMGARQSLGAKGDREVAEAESRRGRLIKYTLENKDKIKKWADEYDDERNQKAYEKTKRGEGLTKEEYFGFLARGPKEGDLMLTGEGAKRVGRNGRLEDIRENEYRDNVYAGKQEKIKNYVEKKKTNNRINVKKNKRKELEQEYAKREYWKAQQEAVNSWKERNIEYDQRHTIIDLKAQYKNEQEQYANLMFDLAYNRAKKMTTKELEKYLKKDK